MAPACHQACKTNSQPPPAWPEFVKNRPAACHLQRAAQGRCEYSGEQHHTERLGRPCRGQSAANRQRQRRRNTATNARPARSYEKRTRGQRSQLRVRSIARIVRRKPPDRRQYHDARYRQSQTARTEPRRSWSWAIGGRFAALFGVQRQVHWCGYDSSIAQRRSNV